MESVIIYSLNANLELLLKTTERETKKSQLTLAHKESYYLLDPLGSNPVGPSSSEEEDNENAPSLKKKHLHKK